MVYQHPLRARSKQTILFHVRLVTLVTCDVSLFSFVAIVPFKKQTLLKWRTTPPEEDTRLPVNECNVTSVVLNENELCEDEEKPVKSLDSSKTSEIHEELSNDSKTETLSDFTIPDHEITEDNSITSQEDAVEDVERTCEPVAKLTCDPVVEPDPNSMITEKPLVSSTPSVVQPQTDVITAVTAPLSTPPGSPEPLVVDELMTSHEPGLVSCDAAGEKLSCDQPSDVKSSSGTDTPQQGKRKKVTADCIFVILLHCVLSRFLC